MDDTKVGVNPLRSIIYFAAQHEDVIITIIAEKRCWVLQGSFRY